MSNTKRPQNPNLSQGHESNKSTQIAIVVAIAVCVGAIVLIAALVKGGGNDNTPAAAGGASTGATSPTTPNSTADTSTSTSTPPSDLCEEPPDKPASPQQFDKAPDKSLAADTTWTATVKTNCGDITLELYGDKAPQTVASFLFLADKGFYDASPCHRLTTSSIYVLQCGDPTGTGGGGPGYGYGIENAPPNGDYPAGTLAMARTSDPNSNGSQFFMVYKDTKLPTDGGGYSIFGKVTGGLDILQQIADVGVTGGGGDGQPAQPISIESISVEKG